jgi:putative hydrolase of the HAD superfamily
MQMKTVRAIFFDVGGTLIHPWPSVGDIYAKTASRHGISVTPEQAERAFRESWATSKHSGLTVSRKEWWRELVVRTLGREGEVCFDELFAQFARAAAWRVYPDVDDTLHEVRVRGLHVGVISNWDERLRPLLDEIGLAPRFDSVTVSCEVGVEKPDAEIFLTALRAAGVNAGEAIHIGDSYGEDVCGAGGVGMRAVLLEREGKDAPGCTCVRELRELVNFLVP